MAFEAQQKSVQDKGSYEGAKIYCLQKLEPEQWRFCDTINNHTSKEHNFSILFVLGKNESLEDKG